jgi:urease accessory protein
VLECVRGGELVLPRPLPPAGATARVALVQAAAALLRGDRVALHIVLDDGAALELIDVAALVAHDVRGGPPARLDVAIELGEGATFAWQARPLVLRPGCAVERAVTLELDAGAVALWRDTIVFDGGLLRTHTAVEYAGLPLHDEALDGSEEAVLRSPAVLGEHRVLDVVALYGSRGQGPAVMQLAGPGSLLVTLASETADTASIAGATFAAWRATIGS